MSANTHGPRPVRAHRGNELHTRSWQTEAPLRMLMNNLDPEVAERPDDLVVYGGTGKAARSWEAYDAIVRTLETLEDDETLLVQSGKPVGVFRTHAWAPRVLIANSNLVGDWATWPEFRRLEALGLTMYGQMTAGSWIYIGTQGILQGTYETFAAVAEKSFGGTLAGTITLTGGAGGMGGAQPLAVTLNEGAVLVVDVDRARLQRRVDHGYLDELADDLEDGLARVVAARDARRPLSVGVVGNAATVFTELLDRGAPIDIVTDQTSAHDPLSYLPEDVSVQEWHELAAKDPEEFTRRSREAMAKQVKAMVEFQDRGAEVFDYGNSIREEARLGGYDRAFEFPGFVPAYIRPQFAEGRGPFRWAALSATRRTSPAPTAPSWNCSPTTRSCAAGSPRRGRRSTSRACPPASAGSATRNVHLAGLKFNELVANGEISAPIVIGRDHLDSGRSPRRTGRPRPWPTAPTRSPTGRCSTPCSTPRPAPRGCPCTTAVASASAARSTPAR